MRRLRGRGLPRSHVSVDLQIHTAPGRRAREENHGESQEAHVCFIHRH